MKYFKKTLSVFAVAAFAFAVTVMPAAASFDATQSAALTAAGFSATEIAALQAILGGGTTTTTTTPTQTTSSQVSTGYVHTKTLKKGSKGAQVKALQLALNQCWSTGLATDGSFGSGTKAAVMTAQTALGLTADGVVGPMTGAHMGSCTVISTVTSTTPSTTTTTTTTTPGTTTTTDNSQFVLSGGQEATIKNFIAQSGDKNELKEGETGNIAKYRFDVTGSDALLERIDLVFARNEAVGTNQDTKPYKVFDKIAIQVDGTEVASVDASDSSNWSNEDYISTQTANSAGTLSSTSKDYRLRITGLSSVVKKDTTAHISVVVTPLSTVAFGSASTLAWSVALPTSAIRLVDSAGLTQETPANETTAFQTFTVKKDSASDKLTVSSSVNDPKSMVVVASENTTSDWTTIGNARLEVGSASNPLMVDEVTEMITLTDPAPTSTTAWANVLSDVCLQIGTSDCLSYKSYDVTTMAPTFTFDWNKSLTLNPGQTYDATLKVKFKSLPTSGNTYTSGATVTASIPALTNWIIEGANTLVSGTTLTGSYTGNTHTVYAKGIKVTYKSSSTAVTAGTSANDDVGTFNVTFDVTAFGADAYIAQTQGFVTGGVNTTTNIYSADKAGTVVPATAVNSVLTDDTGAICQVSECPLTGVSKYKIANGTTETFTMTVTVTDSATNTAGLFRAVLTSLAWSTVAGQTSTNMSTYTSNLTDFKTPYLSLN